MTDIYLLMQVNIRAVLRDGMCALREKQNCSTWVKDHGWGKVQTWRQHWLTKILSHSTAHDNIKRLAEHTHWLLVWTVQRRMGQILRGWCRWLLLEHMRREDEWAAWIVMTNSSFLIPVENREADIPCCRSRLETKNTPITHTHWLWDDLGFIQLKMGKIKVSQEVVVLCGRVLALWWVIMDKPSSHGSCSFMQTGVEMGALIKCNDEHKHKTPLTFLFQPLSKSFILMRH